MDNPLGGFPLLTFLIFLPALGALILAFMPREKEEVLRQLAFGVSLVTLAASVVVWMAFEPALDDQYQLVERATWIPQLGISYHLGVDGLSLLLVVLTAFLSAIAILSSWSAIERRVKEYLVFMLLLETGMLGVFLALDMILFYVFWEAMLIPMYFLIGVWGGPRRIYATIKFVLYTMAGSLLMLVAIVALYFAAASPSGERTFDLVGIQTRLTASPIDPQTQMWMFLAFALAFAIKVPMFPFHTWLPDAHVEAPTAGSVILAGVLLKMGGYGFLRFCLPLFPESARGYAPTLIGLAVIGIVYGALVALVQRDVKKLVAYSSVSHLGFVILGIFVFTSIGIQGAMLQMINHGLSTGALFLIVGMIYERRHTREIAEFGGLWKVIPVFAAFFLITTLSSIGLPGLNGFIGEFLILLGAFPRDMVMTGIATTGVILGAIYMLWMFQRMMQGPLENPHNQQLRDLNTREWAVLLPIVVAMFAIGLFPTPFLQTFDQTATRIANQVGAPPARLDAWAAQWTQPDPQERQFLRESAPSSQSPGRETPGPGETAPVPSAEPGAPGEGDTPVSSETPGAPSPPAPEGPSTVPGAGPTEPAPSATPSEPWGSPPPSTQGPTPNTQRPPTGGGAAAPGRAPDVR